MTEVEPELELLVGDRRSLTADVIELELRHPAGHALPSWAAGAHIDVLVDDQLVRQYSLSGAAADPTKWRIAVLREQAGRGGSAAIHARLHSGASVRVRGPRNHFALEPAHEYLFLAGGIGITPIIPMLVSASAADVPWRLVYGGRSRLSMPYASELVELYGSERVTLVPQDESGILDLADAMRRVGAGALVYCCGPTAMLAAAERVAREVLPPDVLRVEHFAPKELGEMLDPSTFEVVLNASGVTLVVPADRSIVEVVEEAGIMVLTSCEEGTCGTCVTGVLNGVPEHRDSVLTEKEQASNSIMTICCSRSIGPRLVLDL